MPAGLPGVGCWAVTRVIDRARCRNPAVSARVIERVGQNRWLAQLIATPAGTRRLIERRERRARMDVGEVAAARRRQLEAAAEVGGHAARGTRGPWDRTGSSGTRRGDAGRHDPGDRRRLRGAARDVLEVDATGGRELERLGEEDGHLAARHLGLGAEAVVLRRVAGLHDPRGRHRVDRRLEAGLVVVDEPAGRRRDTDGRGGRAAARRRRGRPVRLDAGGTSARTVSQCGREPEPSRPSTARTSAIGTGADSDLGRCLRAPRHHREHPDRERAGAPDRAPESP